MNESVVAFLKQIKAFWTGLSTPKRLALITGVVLTLVGSLLIGVLQSRITYGYLYTELAPEDAAAIVAELKKRNVPHQLEAGGTAILVPDEQRHALRLDLASDGLPRGGAVGFELFDRAQLGATEFEQQVSLRRALEGELSRSIASVEGVKTARVHLVLPERRLFAMRKDSASASVVIKLQNPGSFGKREVAGIVHLVASAVPGLSRDRVSVVSTEGMTLHRPSDGSSGLPGLDGSEARSEHEQAVAGRLETEVREQLERVVGTGNADVRINVLLDAAVTERTEEYWDKDTTALRSEHLVEEGIGATEAGVAGVPGARTNLPDAVAEGEAPAEDLGGGVGAGMRRARTRNWEVDRVTEKTSLPPGSIQRLSVAVLLNGTYTGEGGTTFVPRNPEQVQALEQVVRRAVGFNAERGDEVLVQAAEFARIEGLEELAPELPWWRRYLPHLGAAAVLVFFLCALILVWRSRRKSQPQVPELNQAQQVLRELERSDAHQIAQATPQMLQAPAEDQLRELALEMAAKDPASAALVLKKWLATDEAAPGRAA